MDQPILWSWMTIAAATCIGIALIAMLGKPRPVQGIPHYPVTSILGDIPKLLPLMWHYGSIFEYRDGDDFFSTTTRKLGPFFQVRGAHRTCSVLTELASQLLVGPFFNVVVLTDSKEIEDAILRSRSKFLDKTYATLDDFGALLTVILIAGMRPSRCSLP